MRIGFSAVGVSRALRARCHTEWEHSNTNQCLTKSHVTYLITSWRTVASGKFWLIIDKRFGTHIYCVFSAFKIRLFLIPWSHKNPKLKYWKATTSIDRGECTNNSLLLHDKGCDTVEAITKKLTSAEPIRRSIVVFLATLSHSICRLCQRLTLCRPPMKWWGGMCSSKKTHEKIGSTLLVTTPITTLP